MVFWDAEILVGWMISRQQSIKKAVEFAFSNKANVADFYSRVKFPWTRFPQGMPIGRMLDCKPLAENIIVSHEGTKSGIARRE